MGRPKDLKELLFLGSFDALSKALQSNQLKPETKVIIFVDSMSQVDYKVIEKLSRLTGGVQIKVLSGLLVKEKRKKIKKAMTKYHVVVKAY